MLKDDENMTIIFSPTNDKSIEGLMKMHPISDVKTRKILINYMINKYYKKVFNVLYCYTKDVELTKDILQEAFLYTSLRFNYIKSLSSYEAYNLRTAINIAKKALPNMKKIYENTVSIYNDDGSIKEELLIAPKFCDPYYVAEFNELKASVDRFLERLSEIEREIIFRKYIYCEPYDSIVESLDLNPNTIRSMCFRARRKLTAMINEYLDLDSFD